MIVKPLSPDDPYGLIEDEEVAVDVLPDIDETISNEDGSMTINFGEKEEEGPSLPTEHGANLAEGMDKEKLCEIKDQVLELVDADDSAREDWKKTYADGLDSLGLKNEDRTRPWNGACGVHSPLLMEAIVRFQSQAMSEIYPPSGPAKTRIAGKDTPERRAKAVRIQDELNFQITRRMKGYRPEMERLLFQLAFGGSCFKKIYPGAQNTVPEAKFIPAEDMILPFNATGIDDAERITHVCRYSPNQMKRLEVSGWFLAHDGDAITVSGDDISEKTNEIIGLDPTTPSADEFVVKEIHIELDLGEDADGLALPYIVCVDTTVDCVRSIRRNWNPQDPLKARLEWFVGYEYVPGMGPYGFGLVHLIGGIAKSATSILRQLIDAGTLANLPGGLKSRGMRVKGDDTPITPGEWRDVDVTSGKIADSIFPLPYKEPSGVLHHLLQQLIDEGRRIASIADTDVGDMKGEAPVGTTLALLERSQKVMSAVQARLHSGLEKELTLIAGVIRDYMGPEYAYDPGDGNQQFNRNEDFKSSDIEILPVSDPGATTMAQRVVQHQAAMQMASQAPQLYDMHKLHRTGLEVLGFKDAAEIVPGGDEQKPQDPITENQNILMGRPVKAFPEQDHEAHIAVHMAAAQDPKIQQMVGQSPNAQLVMGAMQQHLAEHLGFAYRNQMAQQMGGQLPAPGQEVPPEMQDKIAQAAVPAAQQLLQQHQNEASQERAKAIEEDPLVQLQRRELDLEEAEITRKSESDFMKMELDGVKTLLKTLVEMERVRAQERAEGLRAGVKIAADKDGGEREMRRSREQLALATEKIRATKSRATPSDDD
jgi:hypothetical protein